MRLVFDIQAARAGNGCPALFEEPRQDVCLLDLHKEIDVCVTLLQFVDSLLIADHTAHQRDQQITAPGFGMLEQSKLVMRFLFRRFAHAACIEYHQVGLLHAALFPAQLFENGLDALGVSLVHLAANGPDVVFPMRNTGGRGHDLCPSPSIVCWSRMYPCFRASRTLSKVGIIAHTSSVSYGICRAASWGLGVFCSMPFCPLVVSLF